MPHTDICVPAKADLPLPVAKTADANDLRDMLPGAVHDLGNLIQVAVSALNILSRNPQLKADPSLPPVVASARMSLGRAGTLVEHALRVARKGYAPTETVRVGSCLAELLALVETVWQPTIRIDLQIEPDLPKLTCNRVNLQGAIMNLLTNARAAMPDGGTISIAARPVAESGHAEAVEIEVVDEGVGMNLDTLQRAFEPFFTTRATGLGGFGLPTVKRFVEDAGGHIVVESKLNAGTRVIIRLPTESGR